jgi:ABC-type transport system substrate-binding protein
MTRSTAVIGDNQHQVTKNLGNILRVGLGADTDYTDPSLANHVVSAQFLFATQAKLLTYAHRPGAAGAELVPEVAVDYPEVSADGRTYTFRLRTGDDAYRFNTGETVTAHHFAYALNRALRPELAAPAVGFIDCIAGAPDVVAGRSATAAGIEVVSDSELRIHLKVPVPDFLHRVSMWYFGAMPLDTPIVEGGVDLVASAGPYYVTERVPGQVLELRRNPYYRHGNRGHIDGVSYVVGVDFNETVDTIEAGQLDYVADGIAPHLEAYLGSAYGVNSQQYLVRPSLQLDYLALNTSRPVFSDPRVRRAVNFAIDRPAILKARGAHAGVLTDHILPHGLPGFRDEIIYPHDGPDYGRARAELPEGYSVTEPVRVYTWNALAGPRIGEIIRENLGALGIPVVIESCSDTELYLRVGRRDEPFDIAAVGITADYPDPSVFINQLLDGSLIKRENNANNCYFDSPEYNQRMRDCARLSGEERFAAYGQLDLDIMRDAAPMIACDNNTKRDFLSSRVFGAYQHAVYGVDFTALTLQPRPTAARDA